MHQWTGPRRTGSGCALWASIRASTGSAASTLVHQTKRSPSSSSPSDPSCHRRRLRRSSMNSQHRELCSRNSALVPKLSKSPSGNQHPQHHRLTPSTARCRLADGLHSTIQRTISSQGPDGRWQIQELRCRLLLSPQASRIDQDPLMRMPASSSHELGVLHLPRPLHQMSNTTGVAACPTSDSRHLRADSPHTAHRRTAEPSALAHPPRTVPHTGNVQVASYHVISMGKAQRLFAHTESKMVSANHLLAPDPPAQSHWTSHPRYPHNFPSSSRLHPSR